MEGLIFFIVMIIFIARVMNKIKKAASGGDKKKPVGAKPTPLKDKLEDLIKSMEEAERLKKGEQSTQGSEGVFKSAFKPDRDYETSSPDEDGEIVYQSREEVSKDFSAGFSGYKDEEILKKVHTRESSVKYDIKDDTSEKDSRKGRREEISDEGIGKNKKADRYFKEQDKKASGNKGISSLSGLKKSSVSGDRRKRDGILDTLSRYPDIQKAVVLKEILDNPVSEKI